MAVLVSIVNGNTAVAADVNQLISAFTNEHLNTAGNEHAETIRLGQNLTNTRRAVRANVLAGTREIAWDQVTGRWVVVHDGGGDRRIILASDLELQRHPTDGTRKITSGGTPTLADDFDAVNRHVQVSLDNTVDAADQTAAIRQTFRIPTTGPTLFTVSFFNMVAATPGTTGVQIFIYDGLGAPATITSGGTLQQNTTWTETIATVNLAIGSWLPGALITVEFILTAAMTKQAYLGEIIPRMR